MAVRKSSLRFKAEKALRKAFQGVVEEHQRDGRPVVIWRNGKPAKVPANRLLRKRA